MKRFVLLCAGLGALSTLDSYAASHPGMPSKPAATFEVEGVQDVLHTRGMAEYRLHGEEWLPLSPGIALGGGAAIRTDMDGEALLRSRVHRGFLKVHSGGSLLLVTAEGMDGEGLGAPATIKKLASVRAVRGEVEVDRGMGWQPLRVNETLPPGAMLRTGSGSTADLFFGKSGLVLRVAPGSVLQMGVGMEPRRAGGFVERPLVSVLRGEVESNVAEGKPGRGMSWRVAPMVVVGRR